ncbi:hypothetical protein ZWY2020_044561 [Hordeum vulgare]|nr:hypothetical protein ZWY2020_044561 [Hordeum vulgare]
MPRGGAQEERCVMATLSSPRIVSCIGRGAVTVLPALLEVCPGVSLAEQVASNGARRALRPWLWRFDVASGLTYLHAAGMVHGDVKSRNVVIGADGRQARGFRVLEEGGR